MSHKSIKTRLNLIISIIICLAMLTFLNYILSKIVASHNGTYHQLAQFEVDIYDTILDENASLRDPTGYARLKTRYEELLHLPQVSQSGINRQTLVKRAQLVAELLDLNAQNARLLSNVDEILSQLVESVRYIHEHHIAYMKNLIARGVTIQETSIRRLIHLRIFRWTPRMGCWWRSFC